MGSRGGNFGAFNVQTPGLHYSCLMISAGINTAISNYSCDYYLIYSTKAPIWLLNTDLIRSTSPHLNFMMSKHTLIITFSLQRHDECHRPQAARLLVCWVWFMKELQHHAVSPAASPPRYHQSYIYIYIYLYIKRCEFGFKIPLSIHKVKGIVLPKLYPFTIYYFG